MQAGRSPARIRTFLVFVALGALALASTARADEQRASRLGLALSGAVTTLDPTLINDGIDKVNDAVRVLGGTSNAIPNPIGHIKAGPLFQVEARFFVSDKIVAVAGFGQIKKISSQELLPGAGRRLLMMGEIVGAPRHIGLDYYFAPSTRADVTMRPFIGGGFMDVVEAHGRVGAEFQSPDTLVSTFQRTRGEGPGFYIEGGVHVMLPSRYSFIGTLNYHHVKANRLTIENPDGSFDGILATNGQAEVLDFSGLAIKFAININIRNKF